MRKEKGEGKGRGQVVDVGLELTNRARQTSTAIIRLSVGCEEENIINRYSKYFHNKYSLLHAHCNRLDSFLLQDGQHHEVTHRERTHESSHKFRIILHTPHARVHAQATCERSLWIQQDLEGVHARTQNATRRPGRFWMGCDTYVEDRCTQEGLPRSSRQHKASHKVHCKQCALINRRASVDVDTTNAFCTIRSFVLIIHESIFDSVQGKYWGSAMYSLHFLQIRFS